MITLNVPKDFPVTIEVVPIGLLLSVRGGKLFHVLITWEQLDRARIKMEGEIAKEDAASC